MRHKHNNSGLIFTDESHIHVYDVGTRMCKREEKIFSPRRYDQHRIFDKLL